MPTGGQGFRTGSGSTPPVVPRKRPHPGCDVSASWQDSPSPMAYGIEPSPDDLDSMLVSLVRPRPSRVDDSRQCEAPLVDEVDDVSALRDLGLARLASYVQRRLPWVSRATGEPAGMWIEDVGRVDNPFEPFKRGTPFVWVGVDSWEAAEALHTAFAQVGRIDESRWIGGWVQSRFGFRKIKIYPLASQTS